MKVKIISNSPYPLPEYSTALSAGMDLKAVLDAPVTIGPLERTMVPTGLFIALPQGYEAQVRPRSGLAAKFGITVLNTPGTIDADYRGEIAQMVVARHEVVEWEQVDVLDSTQRGQGGFGSTGR